MSWRPEGWKTLKPKYYPLHCLAADECVATSYEAGATAMIEALKAGGVKFDKHGDPESMSYDQFDHWLGQIHESGHLIFIPEVQP